MRLKEESIYTLKLKLRGINLFRGREINVLKSLHVRDVYRKSVEILDESVSFPEIVERMANSRHTFFYIVNDQKNIVGSISLNEIRQTIIDYENLKHLLIASDIMNPEVTTISADENLDEVMKQFGRCNIDEFPVIESNNSKNILGSIWQQDVIEIYNREIFLRDMSGAVGSGIKKTVEQHFVPVYEDFHLVEVEAPNIFIGKSLKQLNLRQKYGAEVILVKKNPLKNERKTIQPDANYKIALGDVLLVFGIKKNLEILEKQ
jgi:CBS-domain-containing membrane protein